MKRIHALLAVQSVLAILVSINRLGTWTLGYVLPNEFLRWVDFNNMLALPLVSLVALYLLKKAIEYDSPVRESRAHIAWNLVFIIGLYLTAASYGDHEVTNYLHIRFCLDDATSDLCRIVIFNDDEFSHWVFFTGFVMVNAAILFLQVLFPHRENLSGRDVALLLLNSLFLGLGVFANGFIRGGTARGCIDVSTLEARQATDVYLLHSRVLAGFGGKFGCADDSITFIVYRYKFRPKSS
jgi:hypothetical protein